MGETTVLVTRAEGYRTLALNRPERLNAFTGEMNRELMAALQEAEADPNCRALLLTGTGRGFCAGQDLEGIFVEGETPALGRTLETFYNPLLRKLRDIPMPVICAVNGVAAGAGANFALACDIVLAARSASFIQAFVKIGLVPDCGGTYFLPRLAGTQRAMALAMTGDRLSAADAERMGLVWKVVDDGQLMPEATRLAASLAAGPTRSLGLIKQAIYASSGNTLAAQLDLERNLQREIGKGADYREGVSAFLEKREPAFKGA